jgi:hypothetical protein
MGLKIFVTVSCKVVFGTPNCLGFSKLSKEHIFDNAYKHFGFPAVEGNMHSSGTVIKEALTERNGRACQSVVV